MFEIPPAVSRAHPPVCQVHLDPMSSTHLPKREVNLEHTSLEKNVVVPWSERFRTSSPTHFPFSILLGRPLTSILHLILVEGTTSTATGGLPTSRPDVTLRDGFYYGRD